MRESILLHATRPAQVVPRDQVLFYFPSGRLGYDCERCGSQCCRGHGFGVSPGELQSQLTVRPAVALFVNRKQAERGQYMVQNLKPACFYLDSHNQCSLHAKYGFSAKPETCRLFPFNDLRRAGPYLLVLPHSGLCPLDVLPLDQSSAASAHEALFGQLSAAGVRAEVRVVSPVVPDLRALVTLEKRIVQLASEAHADYLDFLVAQHRAAMTGVGVSGPPLTTRALTTFQALATDVLGIGPAATTLARADMTRVLVVVTPVLRARLVFRDSSGRTTLTIDRVPFVLAALQLIVAVAGDAGLTLVTYQSVMKIFGEFRPLLELLATADQCVAFGARSKIDWSLDGPTDWLCRYLRIVQQLVDQGQRRPLGDILRATIDLAGLERLLFLKEVSKLLQGTLAPASGRTQGRDSRPPLGRQLQFIALRRFDTGLLMPAVTRVQRHALAKRREARKAVQQWH